MPADDEQGKFWDEEVPAILEQAVALLEGAGQDCRYDALVVDEAQDFCELWWYTLTEALLKDPEHGPLYVFMDIQQTLRAEAQPIPFDLPTRYELAVNCRNTQHIAKAGANLIGLASRVHRKAPVGVRPRVIDAGAAPQARLVIAEVRRLVGEERVTPSLSGLLFGDMRT